MEMIKLITLVPHEKNPRKLTNENKNKLKDSLNGFITMMKANPLVVDEDLVIMSGNQRFQALVELGYEEIPNDWVIKITDFDEEQKKEFMIKANSHAGDFDFEVFKDEFWENEDLEEWLDEDIPDREQQFGDNGDQGDQGQSGGTGGEGGDGGGEGYEYPEGEIGASHVKMVQLFLNTDSEPVFRQFVNELREQFGSASFTDAVYDAVKFVYERTDLIKAAKGEEE